MAIGLKFKPTTDELTGQSKWWGAPDLPEDWEYPCQDGNPLTFVCQIRCEDIAALDTDNLLPHSGMLYFFAAIGEYVNKLDIAECDHNGLGEWSDDAYKVLYADDCSNLVTYKILYEDEEPAYLPAEQIIFEQVGDNYDSFKLLGRPYYEEIAEQYPDHASAPRKSWTSAARNAKPGARCSSMTSTACICPRKKCRPSWMRACLT